MVKECGKFVVLPVEVADEVVCLVFHDG
jgi:hypothetical protein